MLSRESSNEAAAQQHNFVFVHQGGENESNKKSSRKRKRKRISEEQIKALQHLSQKAAAEEIGVSLSTFKRKKAEFGIKWPSKRIQKQIREQKELEEKRLHSAIITGRSSGASSSSDVHRSMTGTHQPLNVRHTASLNSEAPLTQQQQHRAACVMTSSMDSNSSILIQREHYVSICQQLQLLESENRELKTYVASLQNAIANRPLRQQTTPPLVVDTTTQQQSGAGGNVTVQRRQSTPPQGTVHFGMPDQQQQLSSPHSMPSNSSLHVTGTAHTPTSLQQHRYAVPPPLSTSRLGRLSQLETDNGLPSACPPSASSPQQKHPSLFSPSTDSREASAGGGNIRPPSTRQRNNSTSSTQQSNSTNHMDGLHSNASLENNVKLPSFREAFS